MFEIVYKAVYTTIMQVGIILSYLLRRGLKKTKIDPEKFPDILNKKKFLSINVSFTM